MSRQLVLNSNSLSHGKCVVYAMSRDQRVQDNHALLHAQKVALEHKLPLVVVFNLLDKTGVRAREHYEFMVTGLKEVSDELSKLNISFILTTGAAEAELSKLFEQLKPQEIFFDLNPLAGPRKLQKSLAEKLECKVSVVDTHNIIPLWVLSGKEEFAAHTIRSKAHTHLAKWLEEPEKVQSHPHRLNIDSLGVDWQQAEAIVKKVPQNGSAITFKSGESAAQSALQDFIDNRLTNYAAQRNVPTINGQSNLSPYLHFGHISALRVALEVIKTLDEPPLLLRRPKLASYEGEPTHNDSVNAFLEELIVRKELADNYCFYNPNYTSLDGAKDWALTSLNEHKDDRREHTYSLEDWENANTHDEAWNAAQKEMMTTGKMHGYMRMYWAKKILEWSDSPEEAVQTAIYLNDHYSLDGGDPNGYTGIMWSIAGVHDRPWFEREVFGKIRYMNRGGLERRFDVNEHVKRWT